MKISYSYWSAMDGTAIFTSLTPSSGLENVVKEGEKDYRSQKMRRRAMRCPLDITCCHTDELTANYTYLHTIYTTSSQYRLPTCIAIWLPRLSF